MIGAVITKIIKRIKFSAFFLGLDVGRKVERAKIIAWLRGETQIMPATIQTQNTLLEASAKIKAEEHLK